MNKKEMEGKGMEGHFYLLSLYDVFLNDGLILLTKYMFSSEFIC